MRWIKWISVLSVLLLLVSCLIPWVLIPSKNIVVSGVDATGTSFGKPGYFHLLVSVFFSVFLFVRRIWAKRVNVFLAAINMAWAVRNFVLISTCYGGECPIKKSGIYLMMIASVLMLVTSLFPDMRLNRSNGPD